MSDGYQNNAHPVARERYDMGDYVLREDFSHVCDVMRSLQETALRVDERVKIILERQSQSDTNIQENRNLLNAMISRVTILESRNETELKIIVEKNRERLFDLEKQVQALSFRESSHDTRWKVVIDVVSKILWTVTAAYVLYKLGFNPPPIS